MSAIDRGNIDTGDRIDELLQRQREADQFWELSVDLLVVADYEGRLLRVSPSWLALTGKAETALLSGDYTEITHPDDVERSMAAVARMREDHLPTRFENRILGPDGTWQTIAWSLSPVPGGERFTAGGSCRGPTGFLRSILRSSPSHLPGDEEP